MNRKNNTLVSGELQSWYAIRQASLLERLYCGPGFSCCVTASVYVPLGNYATYKASLPRFSTVSEVIVADQCITLDLFVVIGNISKGRCNL